MNLKKRLVKKFEPPNNCERVGRVLVKDASHVFLFLSFPLFSLVRSHQTGNTKFVLPSSYLLARLLSRRAGGPVGGQASTKTSFPRHNQAFVRVCLYICFNVQTPVAAQLFFPNEQEAKPSYHQGFLPE